MECFLQSKCWLKSFMCFIPFYACYNPKIFVLASSPFSQSDRPHSPELWSLKGFAPNISVHTRERFSFEKDRINQGLVARQTMRIVKACGHKEKILFSKERSWYNNVLFFTKWKLLRKTQERSIAYTIFWCKADFLHDADISDNNGIYQDYLLQGVKTNLFFQLLSNEMFQLPFEWWHMAVIYSSGDESCLYKVSRAPSWTTLITDVNKDRGLLSYWSINPEPHCNTVLWVRWHSSAGNFQHLGCKSAIKGMFLQASWVWSMFIHGVELWDNQARSPRAAVHSDIGKIMLWSNCWANKWVTAAGKCQPLFQRAFSGVPDAEELGFHQYQAYEVPLPLAITLTWTGFYFSKEFRGEQEESPITARSPVFQQRKPFSLVVGITAFSICNTTSLLVSKQRFAMKSFFLVSLHSLGFKNFPKLWFTICSMRMMLVLTS